MKLSKQNRQGKSERECSGSTRSLTNFQVVILWLVLLCVVIQIKDGLTAIQPTREPLSNAFESSVTQDKKTKTEPKTPGWAYAPSTAESYILSNGAIDPRLGFQRHGSNVDIASGCQLWRDKNVTTPEIFAELETYRRDLQRYESILQGWTWNYTTGSDDGNANLASDQHDVRNYMGDSSDDKAICDSLKLHPDGLAGIFTSLSKHFPANHSEGTAIYMEPLLPPMRHPEFCFEWKKKMNTGYIVHDFAGLCKNSLHRDSRTVFIDIGASLFFHKGAKPPVLNIIDQYRKFGFQFDHIYGYEYTPQNAADVYEAIPDDLKAGYHWYNVGVDSDPESNRNPFKMLSKSFHRDDFVVVKLDIDTSSLEVPLAFQLLEGDYIDPRTGRKHKLADLVDVLYFEHHVFLKELSRDWKKTMIESIQYSMELFSGLRRNGVSSHFWI